MAFKEIQLFPIVDKIKELKRVYAHTREDSNEKETLEQHLNKTLYYLEKIYKEKAIETIREDIYECLRIPEGQMRTLFNEMCINTFYMHISSNKVLICPSGILKCSYIPSLMISIAFSLQIFSR